MGRPRKINALFAKARATERRLYDWMRQHHDDLLIELGEGRIRWQPALQVFAGLHLTDEHGKPPTRDTAIRTWQRVRADVAAARARQQAAKARPVLAPGEIAPAVRAATPPALTAWDSAPPSRISYDPSSHGDTAPLPAVEPGSAPSGHLDRLRASMQASQVPAPKVV